MSGRAQFRRVGKSLYRKMFFCLVLVLLAQSRPAVAQLSTTDPLAFFTNLSSRLLQAEFSLKLNQIQVYPTNQYTPAVHRLLQVTANLWETQTTNETGLPTVFRPRFRVINDAVYLSSYVLVTNDSELAGLPLLDLTASANAALLIPPDGNALVFGVPLVIGARKGLPNFNEFAMESVFVLTRKLELRKSSLGGGDKINQTNQFFTLSVTVPMAVEFWNSYASNYTRPVTIYITNRTTMTLTNDSGVMFSNTFVTGEQITNPKPGLTYWPSAWTQTYQSYQNPASFVVAMRTNIPFLPVVGYLPDRAGNAGFVSASNSIVFDTSQSFVAPKWGMSITNRVHAMILDHSSGAIIDYVLLGNLTSTRDLTAEFSTPTTGTGDAFVRLWSTNVLAANPNRLSGRPGIVQQINISRGANAGVDVSGDRWRSFGTFTPNNVQSATENFNNFFRANSTNLVAAVPFSPSIQFVMPMVWQANDPLVHYLSGELFHLAESGKIRPIIPPTFTITTNTLLNIGKQNTRYKPWPVAGTTWNDPDASNATIKDPLVRSSEDWDFPTNTPLAVESLGRVHRGTPWQTLYLKSSDLGLSNIVVSPTEWAGSLDTASKWATWTGNSMKDEGYYTRPVRDWSLVALIASLINTNDPRQLLSVNDHDQNTWLATLDGLTVLTNISTDTQLFQWRSPEFQSLTLSSDSAPESLLVQRIAHGRAGQPGQVFLSLGDLLATPELSLASPWLNQNSTYQTSRGITDEAYEKIPSQLLSRVRADSVGSIWPGGATWQIQFTGFDNYPYAVESSTNLVNWTSVSTNYPSQGKFTFSDDSAAVGKRFYRSVLLP